MTIGFIGNFKPQHSTENERKLAFEELGHDVIAYQENETTSNRLLLDAMKLDMLVYSHTHDPSYKIDGLRGVFKQYKQLGIPTVSAHLDRWVGLRRVSDVGTEATWFTEYIFMADGSAEAAQLYDSLKLNWFYLPPAVSKKDCYIAKPDNDTYPHQIVFTGSQGYHPEYPYRRELISFLRNTYGAQFGHYGNDGLRVVRGDDLNTLYASAKIVIGDSCFGGKPGYVSDRLTEVTGRGGFIITPAVETLGIPNIVTYQHPNLADLKNKIDYWLANDKKRLISRDNTHQYVKQHHTYTNRAATIIETVGL